MTATPTRWDVRCDRADLMCATAPVMVERESLGEARQAVRDRRWHSGPWREWSRRSHLDLCPACVAFVRKRLAETAELAKMVGANSSP